MPYQPLEYKHIRPDALYGIGGNCFKRLELLTTKCSSVMWDKIVCYGQSSVMLLLLEDTTQGVPSTANISDMLWDLIWVLIIPDSSTRALWKSLAEMHVSQKWPWILPAPFIPVRFLSCRKFLDVGPTALLLLRRNSCCGFFSIENPSFSAGFKPAILGSNGKHANQYTTEGDKSQTPVCLQPFFVGTSFSLVPCAIACFYETIRKIYPSNAVHKLW
jgi:hypothetical protein